MGHSLLRIENAKKVFSKRTLFGKKNSVIALDKFNLEIKENPSRIITIAGESGSGKTTLANLILSFLRLDDGKIIFKGKDISEIRGQEYKYYRKQVQAVFQDPYEVYNPFYKVNHIFEIVMKNFHLANNKNEAKELIDQALQISGLRSDEILDKYPHQLSGGQRQRLMFSRAYLLKPELIVADEPVSMVDTSLRALILETMKKLRDEHNISILYITHDLSTAYQIGDDTFILYKGRLMEEGPTQQIIESPSHPYVKLLVESVPVPDPTYKWKTQIETASEKDLTYFSNEGCPFYDRCPERMSVCEVNMPEMREVTGTDKTVACFLFP